MSGGSEAHLQILLEHAVHRLLLLDCHRLRELRRIVESDRDGDGRYGLLNCGSYRLSSGSTRFNSRSTRFNGRSTRFNGRLTRFSIGVGETVDPLQQYPGVASVADALNSLLHEGVLRITRESETHREQLGGGGALLHFLGQTLTHKVDEVAGPLRRQGWRVVEAGATNDLRVNTSERAHLTLRETHVGVLAGGDFDDADAERPDVALDARLLFKDLGSEVLHRSRLAADRGLGRSQLDGKTQVAELDKALLGNEHVVRLDILRVTTPI